jgi:hypothetical protein
LVSGKDLHQCALAGTVFPQDAVDMAWLQSQSDIRIGMHWSEGLVDLLQFYAHIISIVNDIVSVTNLHLPILSQ